MDNKANFDPTIELIPIRGPGSPKKSRRKALFFCLVAGGVFLSLTTFAAIGWKLFQFRQSRMVTVAAEQDVASSHEEAVAVFSRYDAADQLLQLPANEKRDHDEIQKLFERLGEYAAKSNHDEFRLSIDFDRMLKRTERTGNLRGWSSMDMKVGRTEMQKRARVEPSWGNITVIGIVTPSDDPISRVVYTMATSPQTNEHFEYRFWVARVGNSWKFYDWERLDLGMTKSREWGLYARYFHTPEMDGYDRWVHALNQSDTLINENNLPAAKEQLRVAASQTVPSELEGYHWVLTGNRWLGVDEPKEAEQCYKNVSVPTNTPAAFYGLMICNRDTDPAAALRYGDQYESAVGPNPELMEAKARLLEKTGQKDLAADQWKRILQMEPDNASALRELFFLFAKKNDKSDFEKQLERLKDPLKSVQGLAPAVGYRDYNGLLYLADYLQRKAPNSAGALYIAGYSKYMDGKYQDAANLYRQASEVETSDEKRRSYTDSYLDAMNVQGKLIEACNTLPEPKSAIESLIASYEEGDTDLTDDDYRQIIALYRKRYPGDLPGMQWEVQLAIAHDQYKEAEVLARKAIQHTEATGANDESQTSRTSLLDSLATALYKLDRIHEAYETVGDRKERFSQLARLAINDNKWAEVGALLEKHRKSNPDDPQIHSVAGQLQVHEKNWDIAIRELRESLKEKNNEWIAKHQIYEAYADSGRSLELYKSGDDAGDAFDALANRFISDENWTAFNALSADYERTSPGDARISKHVADAAWARDDYPAYVQAMDQSLQAHGPKSLSPLERELSAEHLLSALLRSLELDRARQLADSEHGLHHSSLELAIFNAVTGNHAEANRFAREVTKEHDDATALYSSEDAGPIFLSKLYNDLQRDFPAALAGNCVRTSAVFVFGEPSQLNAHDVASAIRELGIVTSGETEVVDANRKSVSAFALPFGQDRVWIAAGEGKFNSRWKTNGVDAALTDALHKAQGWLAVGTSAWKAPDRKKIDEIARRLGCRLARGRATAIYVRGSESWERFFVCPATFERLAEWQTTGKVKPSEKKTSWLMENWNEEIAANRQFDNALLNAAHTFEASPGTRFEVMACVSRQLDPLWLEVRAMRRSYGSMQFDGTLQSQSKLEPALREGLSMQFRTAQIQAWRLDHQAITYRKPTQ